MKRWHKVTIIRFCKGLKDKGHHRETHDVFGYEHEAIGKALRRSPSPFQATDGEVATTVVVR